MKFTPITEKTYDFIQSSFDGNLRLISVFIPCKKKFGISLAARMLKKFWMEDLHNQPNPFKSGDIVKITIPKSINGTKKDATAKAKVVSAEQGVVKLRFSDKSIGCVTRSIYHLYQYAKVENRGENLSSFKLFTTLLNKLIHSEVEKNNWSKFLNIDYPVPPGKLSSKVYLIAGKGNVDDTREFVERLGLKDTFGDALIVKESLKEFSAVLRNDQDRATKLNNFIKLFGEVFGPDFNPAEDLLIEYLYCIREKLNQSNVVIEELNTLLGQFIIELINYNYCDESANLKNIIGHMLPDVTFNELDISSVKSVIIDGIELATTYANTIRALHNLKIPVIVLSDYSNYTKERKEKTNNFFRDFSNTYRLNWNKAKINSLEDIEIDNQYFDKESYRICKQYNNQKVTIEAFYDSSNIIDKFFIAFEIRGLLRRIEGFEGIKNAYTIYFRPIIYWVKNMPGSIEITKEIIDAVNSFQETFNISRSQLNAREPDIVNLLDEFLTLFSNEGGAIDNSKTFGKLPVHSVCFKQIFGRLVEKALPLTNCQLENNEIRTLVFTGTPYEEVKQYHLRKALFEDFENVYFLGFCKEAENVYQRFVNDTIRFNRGIHDILPVNYLPFWKPTVELETDVTYLNERCSLYKNETELMNEDVDFDVVQDLIELDRYQINNRGDSSNGYLDKDTKVLVNVLELDGNKSVFIKKTGARKLLVITKNKNFGKVDWDDINPGDRVFTYVITRRDTLEMRGENTIDELVFKDLDIWYEKLKEMWESCNESFVGLAEKLSELKREKNFLNSNPEPSNLRNWLHKERTINAPEKNNLMLILSAAGTSNVDDLYKKIMTAKRRVEEFDRKNRDDIKKQIELYINKHDIDGSDEFIVIVNSVSIVVKHGVVKHKMETVDLRMEQDKIGIVIKME